MQTVAAAATAPAEPSNQDLKVAASARQKEAQARAELIKQATSGNIGNNEPIPSAQSSQTQSSQVAASTSAQESSVTKPFDADKTVANSKPSSSAKTSAKAFAAYQSQNVTSFNSTPKNGFSVFA
jgi:hypothetical protein